MPLSRTAAPRPGLLRLLGGLACVWAGIVVGISFIEAPVKFTAPSLTLPVGLDVGRHVFGALNRVELGLALLSVALVWASGAGRRVWGTLALAWLAVAVQTAWLLPALDARAALFIAGGHPPASTALHLGFGLAEGGKVLALLAVGWLATAPPRAWVPGEPAASASGTAPVRSEPTARFLDPAPPPSRPTSPLPR